MNPPSDPRLNPSPEGSTPGEAGAGLAEAQADQRRDALAADAPHDPYAAIREPNYRWFAGGWLFASIGLQMQQTALLWEVYERTHDALALGYVGLARALPVLVLALPAGQIVDRLDRRKVLLWTQVAFAVASALLAFGSFAHANILLFYALITLTGCARVFNGPSRASLLPLIVRPEHFHNAVTWNSGIFHFSAMVGPLIAGAMIWLTKSAWPVYAVTVGTCLWFAIGCSFIRPLRKQATTLEDGKSIWDAVRPSALLPGMLEGARHVWREKTVLGALVLDLFAVLLGGATALLPVFAKDILHVGPVGLGVLKSAQYVGALGMALVIAHRPPFRRAGPALLWSVAGFGACTILFGLSTNFLLSIAMLIALGALDGVSVVVRHVLVNVRTPDHLRGRVNAVNSVFIESSNELGAFESGAAARFFGWLLGSATLGVVWSVVSGGIGTIVVVGVVAAALPQLRRLGKLEEHVSRNRCRACNYDLSGLPMSSKCPECGRASE